MTFLDAVAIKGEDKSFTVSIRTTEDDGLSFQPLDLNDYSIQFRILGAPTSDAKVLVEHLITQNTDIETVGLIHNPEGGEFTFSISADETIKLGLGAFPVSLTLLDAGTLEPVHTITEGGLRGEFSKLRIVQV